jgi:arylsulfatase A-like enzyme
MKTPTRRHRWIPILILLWLFCTRGSTVAAQDKSTQAAPNIVLFLVDDMGWQDTSVNFGSEVTPLNRRYRTPNMERLAASGLKFTQAYACSVCSPTRVSLMTGLNAARHRVTNWTLKKNATNDRPHPTLKFPRWNMNGLCPNPGVEGTVHAKALPAFLKEAGYHTIHAGKAHFGATGTAGADPRGIGFDVNIGGHAAGGPGSYLGKQNFSAAWRNGDRTWDVPGLEKYHGQDIFLTEALTIESIAAMDQAIDQAEPFFLYLSHYAVHVPFAVDHRFYQSYRDQGLEHTEAMYAAIVEGMDKSLGDILDHLKSRGISKNTIVLFMSDNGGLSASGRGGNKHTHNKPLSSGKGSAHEGGIRVPMIASWPGITAPGTQTDHPLIIEDFFSTILEIAGIQNPEQIGGVIDGLSFADALRGNTQSAQSDRPLHWHFPNHWGPKGPGIGPSSAIRRGDWKLIHYYDGRPAELFNIALDIGESKNLALQNPQIAQGLADELRKFLTDCEAQYPLEKSTGKATTIQLPRN